MKTIKLKYLDFNKGSYTTELGYEYFSGILSKKYKVELSDEPDYVIQCLVKSILMQSMIIA